MPWDAETARSFGERVRVLRRNARLSQEALAYRAGITKNQVQLIEAGRGSARESGPISNPRMKTLFGLASALGVEPTELLTPDLTRQTGPDTGPATPGR